MSASASYGHAAEFALVRVVPILLQKSSCGSPMQLSAFYDVELRIASTLKLRGLSPRCQISHAVR
jgi:hypothetical protein